MGRPAVDIAGNKFGRWFVIKRDGKIGESSAFLCVCDCGTIRRVRGPLLARGLTLSCGCLGREILGNNARKHGRHTHHLYRTWVAMRDRCRRETHDAYHRYGGRGISVCERWNDFALFLHDVEQSWSAGLTLDRIDPNGNYEPGNIRWATAQQQAQNKAGARTISHDGKSLTIREWANIAGITPAALRSRLTKGWPVDKALSTGPLRFRRCRKA